MRLRFLGSLDVCPGESSTQTLFLRVMDTFDDDDDDDESINQSINQYFNKHMIAAKARYILEIATL